MKSTPIIFITAIAFWIECSVNSDKERVVPNPPPIKRMDIRIDKRKEKNKMHTLNITDRFEMADPTRMPEIVPTTNEENLYINFLITSIIDILNSKRSLLEIDPDFGTGKFYWPKDPRKPAKLSISYEASNFKLRSISIGFKRATPEGSWCKGGISVHPRNFPIGIFKMDLPRNFFDNYKLKESYNEKREDEAIDNVNVFVYSMKQKNEELILKFEARPDVSSLNDSYPRSFHDLFIERSNTICD